MATSNRRSSSHEGETRSGAGMGGQGDDPAMCAARAMVRRLLAANPNMANEARRDGIVVAVEVPGPAWVDPVAEAWRELIRCSENVPADTDEVEDKWPYRSRVSADWAEVRRDGRAKGDNPREGNAGIALALANGKAVYGFAPNPEQHLPADLLRAADFQVVVPRPDADAIAEIVSELFAGVPAVRFPAELAPVFELQDLCLARRPGEAVNDCMRRLIKLAERRHERPSITLDQLHGMPEATAWGMALARDLAEFRQGKLKWSAVDRGALLFGPPGTGKTTFAKALAGTCGIPLIPASLNEWQASGSGHLGDLLSAMAASFRKARASAPAILFIDEIDGFGNRATFKTDYKDYSIQVVNGLLEHLDGIAGREGVVVVAACNHPDRLDPAIVRSGRLDRMIPIPLPDRNALANILRHHLGPALAEQDMTSPATLALGATGADCERWVRGAFRRARHQDRAVVIEDLVEEIRGGATRPPAEVAYRSAVHEAGHTVAILKNRPESLIMVTIRQTAVVSGRVMAAGDDRPVTSAELNSELVRLLAGRAAEEVLLGTVSAGAGGPEGSDLARATALATTSLTALGLGGDDDLLWQGLPDATTIGPMLAMRPDLSRRVRDMLRDAYSRAKDLVIEHRDLVDRIARSLVEHETLDGEQVRALGWTQDLAMPHES